MIDGTLWIEYRLYSNPKYLAGDGLMNDDLGYFSTRMCLSDKTF